MLPSVDVQGHDCVQMTIESLWLRNCLGVGRQRREWRGKVRKLIEECINVFNSAAGDHSEPVQPKDGCMFAVSRDTPVCTLE